MRRLLILLALAVPAAAQQPFTLQQVLSAPYALSLTAAPVGARFAWVENAEGVRNLWVGGPNEPARQLTHYTEDDAQDIDDLAWSPDGSAIAYTYGAESGADGHPANPARLQRATALQIIVQPLDPKSAPVVIGEGHAPLFSADGRSTYFIRAGQIWIDWNPFPPPPKPCPPAATMCDLPFANRRIVGGVQLVIDRGSASSLTLSPDGHTLAFISTRRNPSHSYLALFNLSTNQLTFPAPSTGNDSAPAFSPDGKSIAWLRAPFTRQPAYTPHLTSPNPWSIQLLDLATNATHTVYSPKPNKPGSILPHMATGEPKLFWAVGGKMLFSSEGDGWNHLYAIDTASAGVKPILLTPGDGEVEDISISNDRHKVFWTTNIPKKMFVYGGLSECERPAAAQQFADMERRHLSSLDLSKPLPQQSNPLMEAFDRVTTGEGIETHPVQLSDGSFVALGSDSFAPMHPIYLTKFSNEFTDAKKRWLPKSYPQNDLVFPEEVAFPSSHIYSSNLHAASKSNATSTNRQLTIHAQLFLPGATKVSPDKWEPSCDGHRNTPPEKHPKRRPAIIFVHGGPNRQMLLGYPGMDYYSNAYAMNQYLASRGFIVLSVNYRGGIGYGLNFREAANYGPDGASEYNDVLAAQKYLVSRADVDPARIGIWGGSYGGYLTALALARNSNLFAAGVDFHGVHEWSLEGNADRFMPDPAHASSAQHDAAAALAHSSSPMADVDHWRSPVLLIHGDNDPDVAYAQTPVLADALRARHVPVEELIFPDEVHGFLLHKDWLAAYQAAADFFVRTLKP